MHRDRLLQRIRDAMDEHAVVLVIDGLIDDPDPVASELVQASDLRMLAYLAGRERTTDELAALFARSGLALAEVRSGMTPLSLVVARAG